MSKIRRISFFILCTALVLSGCSKKEKPGKEQSPATKATAINCGKKGQFLNSAGTACVPACAEGERRDEKLNRCLVSHLDCGPNQVYRQDASGKTMCQPRCPEDARFDSTSGICLCNFNDRPPRYDAQNKPYCVAEKCDPWEKYNPETKQCEPKDGGGPGDDCKSGEIKVGDKCEKISGPTCKKLNKVLSNDGGQCLDSCPSNQEVDEGNQCQPKSGGGDSKSAEARAKEFEEAKSGGKVIEVALDIAASVANTGVYSNGQVSKHVGGSDSFVNFEKLNVDLPSAVGGGTFIELSPRQALFAKRAGWVFMRKELKPLPADAGKTKVDALKVKVYAGCLTNDCKRIAFKMVDGSVQPPKEYYFEHSL